MDKTEDYRRQCLAREIVRMSPLEKRRAFLDRLAKNQPKEFCDDVKRRIEMIWNARYDE